MFCIRHYKYGPPDVLEYVEEKLPPLQENEVHVQIKFAAINHFDLLSRAGIKKVKNLPRIVGIDAVGEVVTHKCKRVDLVPRRRVIILGRSLGNGGPGAYATDAIVPENEVFPLPLYPNGEDASYENVLALGLAGLTAFYAIKTRCSLIDGQSLLVQGGSGGVASYAIQFARAKNLKVLATTSSPEKKEKLLAVGAEKIFVASQESISEQIKSFTQNKGVDGVLNAIGGPSVQEGLRCLKQGGELLTIGTTQYSTEVTFDLFEFLYQEWNLRGVNISPKTGDERLALLKEILELVYKKQVKPLIDKVFPLKDAAKAHQYIEDKKHFGRVLLDCTEKD